MDRDIVRNSSRLVTLASVSSFLYHWHSSRFTSTTTCQSSSNNTNNHNKRRSVPPRFGTSVRYKHTSSILPEETTTKDNNNDNEEDCPICQKYSQGPCGTIFRQWLDCTNAHEGINPTTKQAWHLTKCSHLATPLAQCLQQHESYYENLDIYKDDNNDDEKKNVNDEMEDLKVAWQDVIKEVEQEVKERQSFPPQLIPELQVRPTTHTAMAAFVCNDEKKTLVLAYIKDDDTGEVLAAGSLQDLWEWNKRFGVLQLTLPETTRSITAHALYHQHQEDDTSDKEEEMLYVTTRLVPPFTGK